MLRLLVFLVSLGAYAIRALFLSRADLLTENLALRQQLAALKRQRPRPPLDDVDRAFWVALRASWPGWASRLLIFDRDSTFSPTVVRFVKALGTKPARTAYCCPWQNPVAERWIGSCRRELLEHVVVLSDGHLRQLIRSYLSYYHDDRCHLGLAKDVPTLRRVSHRPSPTAKVVAVPRIGGLHHRYEWREAA